MKKIFDIFGIVFMGIALAGCGGQETTWNETYQLEGSDEVVLVFSEDGTAQMTMEDCGYRVLENENGTYIETFSDEDPESGVRSGYYVLDTEEGLYLVSGIQEIEPVLSDETSEMIVHSEGTDGLRKGMEDFDGVYSDSEYSDYKYIFTEDGNFRQIYTMTYQIKGDQITMLGYSYTFERDDEQLILHMQSEEGESGEMRFSKVSL